jgi:hypothetical protein
MFQKHKTQNARFYTFAIIRPVFKKFLKSVMQIRFCVLTVSIGTAGLSDASYAV